MERDGENDEEVVGAIANYQQSCVFHACLSQGKAFAEIVEFLYTAHEIVVFLVSDKGLMMKADNRPISANNQANVKETLLTSLNIPTKGFTSWHYAKDPDDQGEGSADIATPIPVNVTALRKGVKGSILLKDVIILYILREDVNSLRIRVTERGSLAYKMDSSVTLLDIQKLPSSLLRPLNTPTYDMNTPVVTFAAKALGETCKDAKSFKVSELVMTIYERGITISFGNNEGTKRYPHGHVKSSKLMYEAHFPVKKLFESLAKCVKLNTNVSIFATKGKPVLFSFGVKDTSGTMDIYMVPSAEK